MQEIPQSQWPDPARLLNIRQEIHGAVETVRLQHVESPYDYLVERDMETDEVRRYKLKVV